MPNKRWQVRPRAPQDWLEAFPEIDPILLQLLWTRGLRTQTDIDAFLEPDFSRDVHDPFLFRQMRLAVDRIALALREQQPIVVYGDYDADGVCSSAVMSQTLQALGGNVDVYIPFRETEGYGLNLPAVEELAAAGAKLLITVDCGTTNVAEVARANELGLDVIVTDHHDQPPVLPSAYAIINPELTKETYPFRRLAASGVAYKLATAVLQATQQGALLGRPALPDGWEKWLLDLVATSTVTDMVPILGENRVFVRFGLAVLKKNRRPGFRRLFETTRTPASEVDEETLAFQVGPRLNAAGRMNHASTAFRLLVTDDDAEALRLAGELSTANQDRQRATENVMQQALEQVGSEPADPLLVAFGLDWPVGVIGLAASKLCDQFARPAVVMTRTAKGVIVGSGRSVEQFDISAAMGQVRDLLDRSGGHPQACGFSLKPDVTPERFRASLLSAAGPDLVGLDARPTLGIDLDVVLDDVNWKLVEDVARLSPFGENAEQPLFVARAVRVVSVDSVGREKKHLRLRVTHATSTVHKTIGFRFGAWVEQLTPGDTVDLVFTVGVNEWNGNREIELKIVDLRKAEADAD